MFDQLLASLPSLALQLPIILLAFSIHEYAHGYIAGKLGDPTARNLGRLTLNPIKHLHPLGFLMMLFFHIGFANPVPINSRNFKNPRRDMALSALAGPMSNLIFAIISALLLHLLLFLTGDIMAADYQLIYAHTFTGASYTLSTLGTLLAILIYILFLSVSINLSLAVFNLLPIPPWDGSRIFYVFLPTKWYFGVMRYERIIMLVMFVLLMTGFLDAPLTFAINGVANGVFHITGMYQNESALSYLTLIRLHFNSLL